MTDVKQDEAEALADACMHEWSATNGVCVACLRRALAAARAEGEKAMRERCAVLVEEEDEVVLGRFSYTPYNDTKQTLHNAAARIRALSVKEEA